MVPSEEDIRKFMSFAPEVSEEQAFVFLEGADSINEALDRFYETPNNNSNRPISRMANHRGLNEEIDTRDDAPPAYASLNTVSELQRRSHTNKVIEAANIRARDEQEMWNMLQSVQLKHRIYNSDIEPEHDSFIDCNCSIHQYRARKLERLGVQDLWSKTVMYPGEKEYHDCYQSILFSNNPYSRVVSPYGSSDYGEPVPRPDYYTLALQQTAQLNLSLNVQAQAAVDSKEPQLNIWEIDHLGPLMPSSTIATSSSGRFDDRNSHNIPSSLAVGNAEGDKQSKFKGLKRAKRAFSIKSAEEKLSSRGRELRNAILEEESGRWPDQESRQIAATYQERIGVAQAIANLRANRPIQYLQLLRAGYFEPVPSAWANLASHPLKFKIDAPTGWRGITPSWRGFENTAEERLYWVLNHRDGKAKVGMKPDIMSTIEMARVRMGSAVVPPTAYYSADDTCKLQHTSDSYSKQSIPTPFRALDAPEYPTGSTVILLDVSKSMNTAPIRPNYEQYLITGFSRSSQPKSKDISKAILRRFTDAMANHDNNPGGYQLVTFSTKAHYIGFINSQNFETTWGSIRFGGQTRVMTGWQKVKDLHFQQYPESATYHPVYGWQAGPRTPMLRLLLILDGEATDMYELELDLLSLPWVHVTIFLIGVDGSLHHHRHANELQRISEANPRISFVDAQGNIAERFATHELLKRHLGYNLSMAEFEALEQPPPSYEE
ncbi:hypothetical protein C8Q69DRAFT_34390 [Paecilomyces variotii]|uniref:VWFA domain-containing protein n=1 Tax=Byssochlamys spectabilis TaxID=264951 RepID=A0A443I6K1_BYSSP|nr:hypothetical protein C8Q69DRAFT_34390 [Paecilomyces variotii]KAJ9205595.1 hypothetical protein DTO032I3_2151 [Paecilomyces variotii]KAJ9280828.1 hypothetical protein DTO021D3_2298 [Paecilomyces variotii]KAJ9317182.1 hypothetical protein DTO271D3_2472 [Paecilomyces variotii]KAJ9345224.1 hypothetical protein DTO027B6_2369 [Paecilomyces variotii]KAJ9364224.1 hypothetical protein DTO280E4_1987 [Paecilomyces variotii]